MIRIFRAWENYWFRPAPLLDLGVCRILIVGFQLVFLQLMFPPYFNRELDALPKDLYDPIPVLHLFVWIFGWNARPSAELNEVIRWVTSGFGVLALVGFLTRPSLICFALGNAFLFAFKYSFGDLRHAEALAIIAVAILALSPAGGALSVDDLRRRTDRAMQARLFTPFRLDEEHSVFARWPLILLGWMMALVYLSAATSKLKSGFEWMNGYTLQHYLLQEGMRWERGLGLWLSQHHSLAVLLSWITVTFEATFFLLLIVPPLAWFYLPLGVLLHLGMDLTLKANFVPWLSIYAAFVPWTELLRRLSQHRSLLGAQSAPRPEILFDDECPLCIRSITVVRYTDWFDRLTYSGLSARWPEVARRYPEVSRADCQREMHVILSDGSITRGFFAFRKLLKYLPPLWPLVAVFYFPLASRFGPRIYRYVASRRGRFQECEDAACAVSQESSQSAPRSAG